MFLHLYVTRTLHSFLVCVVSYLNPNSYTVHLGGCLLRPLTRTLPSSDSSGEGVIVVHGVFSKKEEKTEVKVKPSRKTIRQREGGKGRRGESLCSDYEWLETINDGPFPSLQLPHECLGTLRAARTVVGLPVREMEEDHLRFPSD